MTFQGIRDTPVTATQTVHEMDTIFVTSDLCVVVFAVVFVVVADGMITTTVIASDIATGTGMLLCVPEAAARAARADLKNGETCGQIVLPAMTETHVISLNYLHHLPAHMAKTSLDVTSGCHPTRLPDQRQSKTRRHLHRWNRL